MTVPPAANFLVGLASRVDATTARPAMRSGVILLALRGGVTDLASKAMAQGCSAICSPAGSRTAPSSLRCTSFASRRPGRRQEHHLF